MRHCRRDEEFGKTVSGRVVEDGAHLGGHAELPRRGRRGERSRGGAMDRIFRIGWLNTRGIAYERGSASLRRVFDRWSGTPENSRVRKPFRCVWLSRGETARIVDRFAREGRFHNSPAHHGKRPFTLAWWAASGRERAQFLLHTGSRGRRESWANGLTSADFHAHREALLDIAESRFDTLVERIVSGRHGVAKHRSEVEICGEGLLVGRRRHERG